MQYQINWVITSKHSGFRISKGQFRKFFKFLFELQWTIFIKKINGTLYLHQRLSIDIQQGNSMFVLGTEAIEENFYLLSKQNFFYYYTRFLVRVVCYMKSSYFKSMKIRIYWTRHSTCDTEICHVSMAMFSQRIEDEISYLRITQIPFRQSSQSHSNTSIFSKWHCLSYTIHP